MLRVSKLIFGCSLGILRIVGVCGEPIVDTGNSSDQRRCTGVERRTEEEGERSVERSSCYLRIAVIATMYIAETWLDVRGETTICILEPGRQQSKQGRKTSSPCEGLNYDEIGALNFRSPLRLLEAQLC